ncbi:MAG: carboxymuconolactone decarboxylase family protein [Mycobacteriales bacterium]
MLTGKDPTAGARRRKRVQGPKTERLQEAVRRLDPQLAEWVDDFVFGTVWERPGLSERERLLVAIAMLAARGNHEQLRAYLFGAGFAGVPETKVREVLVMCTVYCGFPTALQSLQLWQEVRASLERQR